MAIHVVFTWVITDEVLSQVSKLDFLGNNLPQPKSLQLLFSGADTLALPHKHDSHRRNLSGNHVLLETCKNKLNMLVHDLRILPLTLFLNHSACYRGITNAINRSSDKLP